MHLDNLVSRLLLHRSLARLHIQTGSGKTANTQKYSVSLKYYPKDYIGKRKLEYNTTIQHIIERTQQS